MADHYRFLEDIMSALRVRGLIAIVGLLVGLGLNAQPAQAQPETITIAAANSLKDALRKILPLFEAEHRNTNVRVIYGPSQTLRSQIEQGAPVDIFLPSLFEEIDQLEAKGLIIQGTKRAFAAFVKAFEEGILIRTTGDIIALSPPLILEKDHINRMVETIRSVLGRVE